MNVKQIIQDTVNETIFKLKLSGMLKENTLDTYQKCEELLRNYETIRNSSDPSAKLLSKKIDDALLTIQNDQYYEVIIMYYIKGMSREYIADLYNTTGTTITRNKARLIDKLKVILFTDDYIHELFS